ncbi:MAG: FAD-dependent oxidoreductase, partial [Nitrospirales bacterium]
LVNQENYVVFQPMLPEVVSCAIEPSHILTPIRHLCPTVIFHQATITEIDLPSQQVRLAGNDSRQPWELPYDHLVISLGLALNLSAVPGMTEHALPLKTLGDAFHLRNHVISRLEQADNESDADRRKTLLTFVTIGGGFSGVETAAAINDMVKAVLPFYPRAQETGARMILIHSRECILQELEAGLGEFAAKKLQERGVEVRLLTYVKAITSHKVVLSTGESLSTETVICTVGNAPHPLMSSLPLPQERGRILVEATLQVAGTTNLWALGDAALVPDISRSGYCPPTAQYAMRQGRHCARNILADLAGDPLKPFRFEGYGQMALIGRHCGIAKVFGVRLSGLFAWALWRSVYLMKLPSFRSKARVAIDWMFEMLFPRDITKMAVERTEQVNHAHFQQGDIIIQQGEIGDRFYIIESGEVEIIRESPGKPEERLSTRSAGDSFGELALLQDVPRTATVRCLTPVNVISFNRRDFLQLTGSSHLFKTHIKKELAILERQEKVLNAEHPTPSP